MLELVLQVSQAVEDSSTGCSVPTRTYRIWTPYNGWEEKKEEDVVIMIESDD
jgi:hypothetical protein